MSAFTWLVASGTALASQPAVAADGGQRAAWTHVRIIGHRGAAAYAPENTLASFRLAGRMGADLIELDVQQSKDGQLVVLHDATFARTTDVESRYPELKPWRVQDLTLKQIRRLDAGSWFGRRYRGERVPTLAEALRTIKKTGAGALVELKNPERYPGFTQRVIEQLKADPYWSDPGRLTVQSFSWRYVRAVDQALPHVRGAVLGHPNENELFGLRWYAEAVHPARKYVTPEYVAAAHRQWLEVYVYVVDDRETMLRMIGSGVDGITTDRPDVLEALRRS